MWGKTMYTFKTNIDKKQHDEFVKQHPLCNLLQSSSWAKIKDNWDHQIVGVYQDDQLVASSLVLIKKLPLSFTMMYLPRGPIIDFNNQKLVTFYFTALRKWAKQHHCLFITLDPGILYSSYHMDDEKKEKQDYRTVLTTLTDAKLKHLGLTKDYHETIQPRLHMAVYQEEFDPDNFTKKWKKNYKIATKKHLTTIISDQRHLEDFTKVMSSTAKRKGISLRDQQYYKTLLDTYPNQSFLTLTYLDIKTTYQEIEERYQQCLLDLQNCPENAKKKRFKLEETLESLTREVRECKENLETYGNKTCVCGTLTVTFGKTSEILYAGMDNKFKRYMAPYLTWYKTMEECFHRGCMISNMGGIEGDLKGGLTDFKAAFHPVIHEYIGEFDLPCNRFLYSLSKFAYKLRKKRHH